MAANRTTFEKLQRDRAKKLKADQKRAKRLGTEGPAVVTRERSEQPATSIPEGGTLTPDQLLVLVERITRDLEAGTIDLDEFEEKKAELMERMGAI